MSAAVSRRTSRRAAPSRTATTGGTPDQVVVRRHRVVVGPGAGHGEQVARPCPLGQRRVRGQDVPGFAVPADHGGRLRRGRGPARRAHRVTRAAPGRGRGQPDMDNRLHRVTHDDGLRGRAGGDPQTARRPFPAVRDRHRFRVFVVSHTSMVATPVGRGKGCSRTPDAFAPIPHAVHAPRPPGATRGPAARRRARKWSSAAVRARTACTRS